MEFERSQDIPLDVKEWYYQPMFKLNANGAKMIWRVGFDGSNIIVYHGHKDGNIQTETIEVETNNS